MCLNVSLTGQKERFYKVGHTEEKIFRAEDTQLYTYKMNQ